MSGPPKPWEMDPHARRQRVRALLIQAALWAPSMIEKDAILEAMQELQSHRQPAGRVQTQVTTSQDSITRGVQNLQLTDLQLTDTPRTSLFQSQHHRRCPILEDQRSRERDRNRNTFVVLDVVQIQKLSEARRTTAS